MIIPNLIIGTDRYGRKLQCGDICSFKIKLQRLKREDEIELISINFDLVILFTNEYL